MTDKEAEKLLSIIAGQSATIEAKIEDLTAAMHNDLAKSELVLLEKVMAVVVKNLDVTNSGALAYSKKNIALIARLDAAIDAFQFGSMNEFVATFGEDLIGIAESANAYFVAVGFDAGLIPSTNIVRDLIGIGADGQLKPAYYLSDLAEMQGIRRILKDFSTAAIAGKFPLENFRAGLTGLIVGREGSDGILQGDFRRWAYDAYNDVHEMQNQAVAEKLGLKHFFYQGSVIKTTRHFCRKKAGKVFTTDEAKKWVNDPDLIDKATKSAYTPLIDRGRYRCRHFIKYISPELYEYQKKKELQV